MIFLLRALLALSALGLVASHGSLSLPPPRAMHGKPVECHHKAKGTYCNAGCTEDACLWYQVGCMVGCDECSLEGKSLYPTPYDVNCSRSGVPVRAGPTPYPPPDTLPKAARTWNVEEKSSMGDFTQYMPWRSPGASPVADPCGVASGFRAGSPFGTPPKGYAAGTKGSEVLRPLARSTTVRAGGVLEAGFGFEVNHGGTPLGGSNPSTAAHSGL